MILIGNKCDLQRQRTVTTEMVEELRAQLKLTYLETSAKTRQNVEESFYELVRQIRAYQLKERPPLPLIKKDKKKKKIPSCNML
jgi:GTPase SAR1 family protein